MEYAPIHTQNSNRVMASALCRWGRKTSRWIRVASSIRVTSAKVPGTTTRALAHARRDHPKTVITEAAK